MLGYKVELKLVIDKSNPTHLLVELRSSGTVHISVYELGKSKFLVFGKREKIGLYELATGEWNDFTQAIEQLNLEPITELRKTNPSQQILRQCNLMLTFAQELTQIAQEELVRFISVSNVQQTIESFPKESETQEK